jgi:lincosamide and streptogramin A transport system ATP-binding/permease protein
MSMIKVINLTFSYESSYDNIFENVSFQFDTNWKLGFIGRNGRGKTTFLNLLQKKHSYTGTIWADVAFEYFPYKVDIPNELSIFVMQSICPLAEEWQIHKELNLLDADTEVLYRPFAKLSKGEQTKLLLAALFLKENAFLLIDEPTNHLDLRAREKVAAYLNEKKGYILVSHDRTFLDRCINHVLCINKTDIVIQKGNFTSWYIDKENRDRAELAQNERLKQDISRLETSAKQSSYWSDNIEKTKTGTRVSGLRPDRGHIGHQAAKMMKRSKSILNRQENAIRDKEKLLKNIEVSEPLKLNPLSYHTNVLVSMLNVSIMYQNRTVCSNVSFTIQQGSRICLSGKNGCGKTSILKLILGEQIPQSGTVQLGSGVKVSYISQDTSWLSGSLTDFSKENNLNDQLFKALLTKLGVERIQLEKRIEHFSEGQKKKVLLAKSLCEPAHLFIWDEPLNYIDLLSRIQIENLILEYKPTLLFVEHDESFQRKIATQTIVLS